jgi:hypothetical protein
MCTHVYTSHRHYYSPLLSTHLPFLAGWLIPTLPVRYTDLSDNELITIRYRTYQIPSISDTEFIRFRTYQIQNLPDAKLIRYQIYQISNCQILTYQIPNLLIIELTRYLPSYYLFWGIRINPSQNSWSALGRGRGWRSS